MNEKEKIEYCTASYFLDAYNESKNKDFKIVLHQDKPDFLFNSESEGICLGVETSTLFYDQKEARMLLGRSNLTSHGIMSSLGLVEELNKKLEDKCRQAQKYSFQGKLVLVFRMASPVFDISSIEIHKSDIKIPADNKFQEIWILCQNSGREWKDLYYVDTKTV